MQNQELRVRACVRARTLISIPINDSLFQDHFLRVIYGQFEMQCEVW